MPCCPESSSRTSSERRSRSGALVFGLLAVVLIGLIRGTSRVKEDAAIGIVFTTLFALGLVLISVTPSQTDLNHIIFGNILGVSEGDLIQIASSRRSPSAY